VVGAIVGVGASDDVEAAQKTLLSIADRRVMRQAAAVAYLTELPALKVALRYWSVAADYSAISADLMKPVEDRCHRRKAREAAQSSTGGSSGSGVCALIGAKLPEDGAGRAAISRQATKTA
jgi:hypothetical protein